MASVHFLNVAPGDCTIIRHSSGHVTMVDICDGNAESKVKKAKLADTTRIKPLGHFRMCEYPTNPIQYLNDLGISGIFRFILTHPDMDHMDGLNALVEKIGISNFWDTSVRRDSPEFGDRSPYDEADWDCYENLRNGKKSGVKSLTKLAGSRFKFANIGEDDQAGGDGLYILAPDTDLVRNASDGGDINDGSFVLLYRSSGGRILLPGDAHDSTWEYVLTHYKKDVANCSVMIAPHHGRDSDRSFDFLDKINPKLTLFGCAPSEHLAYEEWNRRNLEFITSNQAGNIVLEIDSTKISVYIENETFERTKNPYNKIKNSHGYIWLEDILKTDE